MLLRVCLCTLIGLLCLTTAIHAQTDEITVGNHSGVDARALGMGAAFTAVADNASALQWNPAGLSQLKRHQFSATLSHINRETKALLFGGDSRQADRNNVRLNMLSAAFPLTSAWNHLVFALGISRVQNLDTQTDVLGQLGVDAPVLAGLAIDERTRNTGGIYSWSAGIAGRVSQRISIGGTLDIWTGDHQEELLSEITDPDDVTDITFQTLEDTVDRSYLGFGVRLGGLMRVNSYCRIGAHIQMPMSLEIDEYWTQDTFELDDDGTEFEKFDDGTLLYDLRLPISASIGLSLGDTRAQIAADLQYTNWTSTAYSTPPEVSIRNSDFQDFYRDVLQWRIGAEYLIEPIQTRIRVGYWNHPLAFTANKIVSDREFLTFGMGTLLDETIGLDVAYVRGTWQQDSDVLAQEIVTHQIFVSASYRQ